MCRRRRARTMAAMNGSQAIALDVHLCLNGEEMSGEVVRQGCPRLTFSGWLGLLGAVERARELTPDVGQTAAPQGRKGRS